MTTMAQEDVIPTIARGMEEGLMEAEMMIEGGGTLASEEVTMIAGGEITMIVDPPEVIEMRTRGGSHGMMIGAHPLEMSHGVGTMDRGGTRGHVVMSPGVGTRGHVEMSHGVGTMDHRGETTPLGEARCHGEMTPHGGTRGHVGAVMMTGEEMIAGA